MNGLHLLIVDDEREAAELLKIILEENPRVQSVAVAYDGMEAVDQARRHKPDIVIMDLEMPRMDGEQAAHLILAEYAAQPPRLIALSGNILRLQALRNGPFHAHLGKPVDFSALDAVIA